MIINEFIRELKQKDIEIYFSTGKLKYSGPEENITPDIIEQLKKNKGKLIKYFWPKEFLNLMPLNVEGSKIPIFIVHGDNANYIINDYLGNDQPLYGFFHPGSEGEKISYKSVEDMASVYLDQLLKVYPIGPFYLIGFSFGGNLAFEMALKLKKMGQNIPFLIIIDSICSLAQEPTKWDGNLLCNLRKNIFGPFRRKIRDKIKLLFYNCYHIINKPIPIALRKDYMYQKYLSLASRYYPSKFEGNILLFRATENNSSYRCLGWEFVVNEIKIIEIEGKHLEIFSGKERNDILTSEIEKYLNSIK